MKRTKQANPKQAANPQPLPIADPESPNWGDSYVAQHERGEISFYELIPTMLTDEQVDQPLREAVAQLAVWMCGIVSIKFPTQGTKPQMSKALKSALDKFRHNPEARKRWREGSKRVDAMMKEDTINA